MKLISIRVSRLCMTIFVACAGFFAVAATHAQPVTAAVAEEKVVYHVDDMGSVRNALNNITNHLEASPQAKISLIANGRGIFMLATGESDRIGEYSTAIAALQARGVNFVACRNSMKRHKIEASALVPNAKSVQAGVAELSRLQGAERYAYIKP